MTAEIRHITPSFRKIVVSTNARSNITLEQFIVISILERIVEMLSSVYLTIVTRCLRQREPDCRGVFVTPVNDRMLADEWEEVSHHLLISLLRTNLSTGAKLRLLGACHHSRTRPEQRKLTNNNELLRRLRFNHRMTSNSKSDKLPYKLLTSLATFQRQHILNSCWKVLN